jgi:hypothetical protein
MQNSIVIFASCSYSIGIKSCVCPCSFIIRLQGVTHKENITVSRESTSIRGLSQRREVLRSTSAAISRHDRGRDRGRTVAATGSDNVDRYLEEAENQKAVRDEKRMRYEDR